MAQNTTGLRSLLSSSPAYRLFQHLMGAQASRATFVRDYIRVPDGACLLDVGCGPADILDHLPPGVSYWGFDISERYIADATARFGSRGHFSAKEFESSDLASLPSFDVVTAIGLFHHLDDATAATLLATIRRALKPGGRLVTLDGVFERGQNPLARWLISMDRGRHVRTGQQYQELFGRAFPAPRITIQHRRWIPYTYCLAECTRPLSPDTPAGR
jgi:SAM-dependent methyltransferase